MLKSDQMEMLAKLAIDPAVPREIAQEFLELHGHPAAVRSLSGIGSILESWGAIDPMYHNSVKTALKIAREHVDDYKPIDHGKIYSRKQKRPLSPVAFLISLNLN